MKFNFSGIEICNHKLLLDDGIDAGRNTQAKILGATFAESRRFCPRQFRH
jgi:hypothetical protein